MRSELALDCLCDIQSAFADISKCNGVIFKFRAAMTPEHKVVLENVVAKAVACLR